MGGKRPAGARYPHVTTEARPADHRYCPVLARVADQVARGREEWGYLHVMPDRLTEAEARDAEKGLYRARNHSGRTCSGQPLSIKVHRASNGDGTYTVSFQVWTRAAGKAHITGRVQAGETLAYNVLRR